MGKISQNVMVDNFIHLVIKKKTAKVILCLHCKMKLLVLLLFLDLRGFFYNEVCVSRDIL